MHRAEVGWLSAKQTVTRGNQAHAADLISGAGYSLWLYQTPLAGRCLRGTCSTRNSGPRRDHARETLLCPRPGLVNASGLCPKTLLVSVRLGGGAATGHLVTNHQAGEREGRSNQRRGLRASCPDAPAQSGLYIRKEHQEGSALWGPVRR